MKQNHKKEEPGNDLEDLPAPTYAPLPKNHRYLGNERWHGQLLEVEEWEQIRAAGLRKLIVSLERAAEIQRLQPFEDIGRPLCIAMGGMRSWTTAKIRVPKKLREASEKELAVFGLSLQQQKLQEAPHAVFAPVFETTPRSGGTTVTGFDGHAFAKHLSLLSDTSGILSLLDNADLFRGDPRKSLARQLAFSVVRTRKYERLIPDWMLHNQQFRSVVEAIYPKWNKNKLWRKRTAKIAAVLYRYFRVLEPTVVIAEDLGINVRQVENTVAKASKMGEQLFPKPKPQPEHEIEDQFAA